MQRLSLVLPLVLALAPARLAAQDPGAPSMAVSLGEPRFLSGIAPDAQPVEPASVPALRRPITLTPKETTLGAALDAITRQTGIRFLLSSDVISLDKPARVEATGLSLAAVLTELLLDVRVDVAVVSETELALVRRGPLQPGTIEGTVLGVRSEGEAAEPVASAQVIVGRTGLGTLTDEQGRFQIAGVPVGRHSITVSSIGWKKTTQEVDVGEGLTATVDFTLEVSPTTLSELVVTATGVQRRVELGHVVGRINADSVVRAAPVSSLSELLTGRVPGLQVYQSQGTVGGSVQLQVRTPNSISLGTEPIVIVDGIRYTSSSTQMAGAFNSEGTSRLNDINPNDIESVEVVKGPSSATLYGTDAANGVIVMTTKRGRAGPPRWNVYGRATTSSIPEIHYPEGYWGWGSASTNCRLQDVAAGSCAQDSVTVIPNPLNDPELRTLASKPRWEYGANVSGGGRELRYYFSGDFERAIGPIQMPPAALKQLREQRGVAEVPEEQLEPNALTKANLRAGVTVSLGETAELQVNTGYVRSATRNISLVGQDGGGFGAGTPENPYGEGSRPEEMFALTSTERLDRFFGSASGQWRPTSWLLARATVGLDLANSTRASLARPGESPIAPEGKAGDDRMRQVATTVDLGLTASLRSGRIGFRTAVGAQYVRNLTDGLSIQGGGLPPGGESVSQAASTYTIRSYAESVTLGSYVEHTLGLNDRLFLTGALRADGASAFGRDYDAVIYPKAGVSWILSEEPFVPRLPGLDELRLRYAFGASGQQALSSMAVPIFVAGVAVVEGATTPTVYLDALGNPDLRPERVREHEFGLDVTGLQGRVRLGLTWFRRTARDQILARPLPPGLGGYYTNLGLTTGRGFEAEVETRLVESSQLSWEVFLKHSIHRTELVDLGDVRSIGISTGGYVEGYPLGARFSRVTNYTDANGDGIIDPTEIQGGDLVYLGESTPPRTETLTTVLGLFQRRLRLSALIERRSGFSQLNWAEYSLCGFGRCRAAVDPATPLAEQAAAIGDEMAFIEPGDFTRLREVTAALDLPTRLAGALRLRSATLSVAARNLALWTSFSGPDPESAFVSGYSGDAARGIPQARSWTFRLDLGF